VVVRSMDIGPPALSVMRACSLGLERPAPVALFP
jgi:hypothetical protein